MTITGLTAKTSEMDCSGVRQSSGAASRDYARAAAFSTDCLDSRVAAPEDGRTPLCSLSRGLLGNLRRLPASFLISIVSLAGLWDAGMAGTVSIENRTFLATYDEGTSSL